MNVGSKCKPYPFRSRCTVVESCGTAFVSSSYLPSCGYIINIGKYDSFTPCGAVSTPCQIIHRDSGDLGYQYTWGQSLHRVWSYIPAGVLLDCGLPGRNFDVHDLLSVGSSGDGNEENPWRRHASPHFSTPTTESCYRTHSLGLPI